MADWSTRGKPIVLKEIAAECGLEQTRPSKWMAIPEFRQALADVIRHSQPQLIEGAISSVLQMAAKGNLLAFDKVFDRLERLGRLGIPVFGGQADANAAPASSGVTTNVHIHGIPARQPFENLPPPRALPTPSAPPPTAPAAR